MITRATRGLVAIIQAYPGVTDGQRIDLGITVRDDDPGRIPVPGEMPVLQVAGSRGRVLSLRLKRADGTVGKPKGVTSAQLWRYVGDVPPGELSGWEMLPSTTKTRPQVVLPEGTAAGTRVWLSAAWLNPRRQMGQACQPVGAWTNHEAMTTAA